MNRRFKTLLILVAVLVSFCFPLLFRSGNFQLPVAQAASPITLPAGFADEVVVGAPNNGLLAPRAFTFTPDGRILIVERGDAFSPSDRVASIRVFKNGNLLPTRALTLNVCGDSERGFLAITVDPNFSANGYVYVFYSRQGPGPNVCALSTYANGLPGPRNRLSRFTMVGDTIVPGSELVLIDTIISDSANHSGSDLHFDSQGYLYVTTGDSANQTLPQNTALLNGKLLRLKPTPTGYITTGNPFETSPGARNCGGLTPEPGNGPCREIYAYGFRNPYRFSIQPGTDTPFVGDVGQEMWEEIDQVIAGGNYGWPIREGYCAQGANCSAPYNTPAMYSDPIHTYRNIPGAGGGAVVGGPFYTGTDYPAQYHNNYFFTDFMKGWIKRLIYDAGSNSWTLADFATNGPGIIDLVDGPDGNLYYLRVTDDARVNEIRRIVYTNANQPPFAKISANPVSGPLSTEYTFSAEGSFDPDNNLPLTYHWNFGDGQTTTTAVPMVTHTYSAAVNRTVTLTITDSASTPATSAPATVMVYPNNNPVTGEIVLTNLTTPGRTNYYAGDIWRFQAANINDPDGNNGISYAWQVVFHHREHFHPFIPNAANAAIGQFIIPVTGESDYVVWYRVHLTITDSRGQQTRLSADVNPVLSSLTLQTDAPGGIVLFEGGEYTAPYAVTRVAGLNTIIGTKSPQWIGGIFYLFDGWLHGGAQTQTIAVPPVNTQYTARLQQPTDVLMNYSVSKTVPLTWNRVSNALGYQIEIDDDPNFGSPLAVPAEFSPDTLIYTTPQLANGLYYWHVRSRQSVTTWSAWSERQSFIVSAP